VVSEDTSNPHSDEKRETMRTLLCFTTILLIVMTVATSPAGGVVIPTGLTEGDPYHLAFVTSGTRTGNSTDIAVYNTFVQDQAAMNSSLTGTNVGVTYTAIASTETVDASDNALVEAPIYLLDGTTKVADGFSDLWDGTLDAPLDLTQDAILCVDCSTSCLAASMRAWSSLSRSFLAFARISSSPFFSSSEILSPASSKLFSAE